MDIIIKNGSIEVLVAQATPIALGRPFLSREVTRVYGKGPDRANASDSLKTCIYNTSSITPHI
jgi:hypothetical protein